MTAERKGELYLLFAAFIGATGFISMKYLLVDGFTPFQIIAGRFLVGVLCMLALYWRDFRKITPEEWKAGMIVGSMLFMLFALMTIGLKYTTPSVNAFLANTQAIFVPFIVWTFFKRSPDKYCFLAAFMTLIGVAFLSVTKDFRIDIGAILSLLSSVAFAFQMVFIGEFVQKFDAIRLTIVENITVCLLSCLCVVFLPSPIPSIGLDTIGNLCLLGVFCTAIYFLLQSIGQQKTTASKTAIIITFESVFTVIMAAILYGERLTLRGYSGCVILFLAILVAEGLPLDRYRKIDS